jgi:hypothetical protein
MERNIAREASIKADNYKVFALLSHFLNHAPDYIKKEEIREIVQFGVTYEYAYAVLLTAALGLDIEENMEDKELFNRYFSRMVHKLDAGLYADNPYYKNIRLPQIKIGNSELKYDQYAPFEGFVCNDIVRTPEGRQLPQIGFFDREFEYPAVLENNRIWMTVTPNEIETMKEAVEAANGHVLAFGLGLGYYPYMVSLKEQVKSVTVVEVNPDVIGLFQTHIMPQFPHAHKLNVIQADAFEFAQNRMPQGGYDFVFTDLWHDVSDGMDMYFRMKQFEGACPGTEFAYWIEKSILCYV